MSPAQADDSYDAVMKGWECQETDRGVPFYIHKTDGKTDWDHPYYTKVIEELDEYQEIHYAAYRTALKLRHLQKKFGLHLLSLQCLQSVLDDHGFPQGCTGLMDSQCLQLILLDIFHTPDFRHFDSFRQDMASELLHNYLLNLFDVARTGVVKVLSVKLTLAALCNSTLTEKYQYFFNQIKSSRAFISRDQLSAFVSDLIQIPDLLRESVAFGKNVLAAVDSCVQVAGTLGDGVPEKGFLAWLMREPQTLIWLPTMHRLIASETVKHDCKCSVCKVTPIVGFRYKCLQCFKFNICQDCFFRCQVSKNHKLRHPIQEYCLPITAKDETKVFLKVVRNKLSRRSRGSSKTAFLPVDNTTDQGLLEWEMRPTPTPPTPPSAHEASRLAAEGEAASNDSGHSSDQGGEGSSQKSPGEPTSPPSHSLYDNSNSPARYLEERQPKNGLQQDRHSLIHLVHRLRRENSTIFSRLLRQQLRSGSFHSQDEGEQWKSVATAEVTSDGSGQSQPVIHSLSSQGQGSDITAHGHNLNGRSTFSRTISPIGDTSSTVNSRQGYTSDFFNSILANTATTAATATFDVTPQDGGLKSSEEMVFASTPAVQATPAQKLGPPKPPRLTGTGDKITMSISYIHAEDSPVEIETKPVPAPLVHKVEIHSVSLQDSETALSDITEKKSPSSEEESKEDTVVETPQVKNQVSCDEMWADITPCTIRKRASKPVRLVDEMDADSVNVTPTTPDMKTRRKSTGSVTPQKESETLSNGLAVTPKLLKSYGSLNRLGVRTPGVDKSLFAVSRGDSILKTPERQEIDKMIEWIDSAFPSDLSYSALSLCHDESTTQKRMLRAAESIGHAMADLVQATSDNCYM